jgi:hypothetical protein
MAKLKAKVSRSFIYLAPNKKGTLGSHIIEEIGDHPLVFVTPDPTLANMTLVNNDLVSKTTDALTGEIEMIELRDAAEVVWNTTFNGAADYVDGLAKGDAVIIAQSGFDSTKTETVGHDHPGFTAVKKMVGNVEEAGTILFEVEHTAGAFGHIFIGVQGDGLDLSLVGNNIVITTTQPVPGPGPFPTPSSPSKAVIGIGTHPKFILGTFPSASQVGCRVLAFNAKGFGAATAIQPVVAP